MEKELSVKGGSFMIQDTDPKDVFIPEELDEEQQMIAQTCQDFLDTEVLPVLDEVDSQQEGLMPELLAKAGELGLLGISVPEEYEGFGQSFVTSMVASEIIGAGYSFAVAYSCHTGIGSLPIAYYGNHEQKEKYLTKLATGEWKGAYCLTEPGAGSDANSGKTKAVLSEDGKHYILNGQKMWITNAGFADVMTVFAKIDNDRVLSAFIVERTMDGITFNPEEKKMGIKGSSTRQIFFNDLKVPVENLLAGRGQGFRIALNILHMGRVKLGGNIIGAAKIAINQSVNYSNERKQFGMLINNFGSIKHKLGQQVVKTYATESAVYRAAMNIDQLIEDFKEMSTRENPTMVAFNQMAIEAAILKVYSSEALDYIADEAVQIFGGMGYSAEMPVDRGYRDSRINRIFEGTNEINRILVVDTLLKRGQKKDIPLFEKAAEVFENLNSLPSKEDIPADYYGRKKYHIDNLKSLSLAMIHSVSQKYGRKLMFEQELLNGLSDIIMNIYVAESTMLRVQKLEGMKGADAISLQKDILDICVYEAVVSAAKSARDVVNSFSEGEELGRFHKAISVYTDAERINVKDARRRIADHLIDDNKYSF
ncbi:MAG: acyl-CoA dehydrogenase [Bacteroidetes bacterium]|jgi:alkylation response protein AidB-like acyl-CoA dehydrogenase|nr:acyl-CoA dehydrogenase [Bacteroidota bacterium]MBT3749107.1 acyl-CoA dehydrogenase [Bacteroidota bacterium]MBT4399694.1 acyl-CoA dehydrogenase [Bacteroidota bacterium]MBT4409901.1 acyl-CoA dehydrogenase [Bacteroidota bacterium]MBT7463125.1 acyl-CoA dehydrogenase [Bacteroidota bacterium]